MASAAISNQDLRSSLRSGADAGWTQDALLRLFDPDVDDTLLRPPAPGRPKNLCLGSLLGRIGDHRTPAGRRTKLHLAVDRLMEQGIRDVPVVVRHARTGLGRTRDGQTVAVCWYDSPVIVTCPDLAVDGQDTFAVQACELELAWMHCTHVHRPAEHDDTAAGALT